MSKFIQALLVGVFFTFIYDYLLFLGMFLHYIKPNEIPEYYNILFADHQNYLYILLSVIFIGFVSTYLKQKVLSFALIFALLLLSASALIPTIGKALAKSVLYSADQRLQDDRYIYKGETYYEGREIIYFYDEDLQKMINIQKKDLKK